MEITRITKTGQSRIDNWYDKALKDAAVRPYLSFAVRIPHLSSDSGDDWACVFYMDDDNQALLRASLSRDYCMREISFSLWVLESSAKRRIAGRMLMRFPSIAESYGAKFMDASCHASNVDSARLLRRRFGESWGRQAEHGWNPDLGRFEDTLHFRTTVADWRDRCRKM